MKKYNPPGTKYRHPVYTQGQRYFTQRLRTRRAKALLAAAERMCWDTLPSRPEAMKTVFKYMGYLYPASWNEELPALRRFLGLNQ